MQESSEDSEGLRQKRIVTLENIKGTKTQCSGRKLKQENVQISQHKRTKKGGVVAEEGSDR